MYCLFSQQMYTSIFKNGPTVITTMFCWHNINFSGGAGHIKGIHKESCVWLKRLQLAAGFKKHVRDPF